jgi:hypothetical protein
MSSFFKDFQRGYRLVAQPQTRTPKRSIHLPYLDGIPQATSRYQLTKRLIKQILLTLTLALIGAAIWPWDRVRAICANVASLDRATSRCSRAKHCHKGFFSEEFGRTPVHLTPGWPEMG